MIVQSHNPETSLRDLISSVNCPKDNQSIIKEMNSTNYLSLGLDLGPWLLA